LNIITEAYGSEAVRTRIRNAGTVAFALTRMRSEKENIGFAPLPFGEYLHGLAKLAGVAIAPVLQRASIRDLAVLNAKEAKGVGRLARALGFRLEELFLSLRIAVAEGAGGAQSSCWPHIGILRERSRLPNAITVCANWSRIGPRTSSLRPTPSSKMPRQAIVSVRRRKIPNTCKMTQSAGSSVPLMLILYPTSNLTGNPTVDVRVNGTFVRKERVHHEAVERIEKIWVVVSSLDEEE
jgi:hypothetical protein